MKYYRLSNTLRRIGVCFFALVFCLGLMLPVSADVSTLSKVDTEIVLFSNPNPSRMGATVIFTTRIIFPNQIAKQFTGSLTFREGNSIIDIIPVEKDGITTIKRSLSLGSHKIVVEYSGDLNFKGCSSEVYIQNVVSSPKGYAWAWGGNEDGQLGNNSSGTDEDYPVLVKNSNDDEKTLSSNVEKVDAGGGHSLAFDSQGDVYSWGENVQGQLGRDFSSSDNKYACKVNFGNRFNKDKDDDQDQNYILDISAGYQHSLLLDSSGVIWAWGDNSKGQLGSGSFVNSKKPIRVTGPEGYGFLENITAISAGYWHSLAVMSDGTVWAWGDNSGGQLGNGTSDNRSGVPVQIKGLNGIVAVATGQYHNLALKSNGTVYAWGKDTEGQLGDSSIINKTDPVLINRLNEVIEIAAGQSFCLALDMNGNVWGWGNNDYGQLGDNTSTNNYVPVPVKKGQQHDNPTMILNNIISIDAGFQHSLALDRKGEVFTWGDNGSGQLGNSSTGVTDNISKVPVRVDEFDYMSKKGGDVMIAAGGYHNLAIYNSDIYISTDKLKEGNKGKYYEENLEAMIGNDPYFGNNLYRYIDRGWTRIRRFDSSKINEYFTWELTSDSIDNLSYTGLQLNKAGSISGICKGKGVYYLTFRVNHENGCSAIRSFTLGIQDSFKK